MHGGYPALNRLRGRKAHRRTEHTEPTVPSGPVGFVNALIARIRDEWHKRSASFISGLISLLAGIVFLLSGIVFFVGGFYTGLKLITGSELAAYALMFLICVSASSFLMIRALRNFRFSVEFNKKDLNLRITD